MNSNRRFHIAAVCLLASGGLIGCRWIRMTVRPEPPRLGDYVKTVVEVGESEDADIIYYDVAGMAGKRTTAPFTLWKDTKRETGNYMTSFPLWGKVVYNDGEEKRCKGTYDLTRGSVKREDDDLTYAVYVAKDDDSRYENARVEAANAFSGSFDAYLTSYTQSQYYWAAPFLYENDAYANDVDLLISFTHGNHHAITAGNSDSDYVDLSERAYGSFTLPPHNGDLEYLVLFSCDTLSISDAGGFPFWYYWFNEYATRLDYRPFNGLHVVMGFRTLINHNCTETDGGDCESGDCMSVFGAYLSLGMTVIEAWQEAVGAELSLDDGDNMGTVFYLKQYENDSIYSVPKDDYIYGNSAYGEQWYSTWE